MAFLVDRCLRLLRFSSRGAFDKTGRKSDLPTDYAYLYCMQYMVYYIQYKTEEALDI